MTDPTTNSSQLYFVRDGKARIAVVQLGIVDEDIVQILSGLGVDAIVALDHLQDLYDSESVQVSMEAPAAGSGSASSTSGAGAK